MAKKSPAKKAAKPAKKTAPKPAKKAVKKAPVKKAVKKVVAKKPAPKAQAKAQAKAKAPAKKAVKKVAQKPAKKAAKPVSKPAAKKSTLNKAPVKKAVVKAAPKAKVSPKKAASKAKAPVQGNGALRQQFVHKPAVNRNLKLTPFLTKQRQRLLQLKDTLLDSMKGVARDNLHAGSETSAFGMHQADAGSDAYDRDFALSILSQEQNSLYEIDEALKRIETGTYGQCEICNKPIPQVRLEARPFTRTTVDCQEQLEKRQHHQSHRLPINSLFGLTEEESESDEEETTENS